MATKKREPIATESDWNYERIEQYYSEIERIAETQFKLNCYPNQIEIISSEQMLEAYATHALPLYYDHWSTGMQFVREFERYKRGWMGLAYEVVINSNPCIAYLMEENTMLMQILVMAHACFGHNHFFKNNYLFQEWTDADSIIDYLVYVKKYIRDMEELHGEEEITEVLDACHALQYYSVNKYKRPPRLSAEAEKKQHKEREEWLRKQVNVLWSTIPKTKGQGLAQDEEIFPSSSEENILLFIEENAPKLEPWKREVIRIVRKMAQYFYPQMQTQLMNEGFATFMHYSIMQQLYDENLINDGYMMEFIESHSGVVHQLDFDNKYYSGINVYALGFAMYKDIKRISVEPTEEDRSWFHGKEWVGNGEWLETIHWAAANFKDESFILEFLSPKIMRDFKLFDVLDDDRDSKLEIAAIHNDKGYKRIREKLALQYNLGWKLPEMQVAKGGVDRWGDRSLTLQHVMYNRCPLDEETATETLKHSKVLWGYPVKLESIDNDEKVKALYEVADDTTLLDVFIDDDT